MSLKTNPVSSGYSTGVINSNFKKIEEYVNDNLLNRDGVTPGEPNQMEVDLDMNSNDILNVGRIDAKEIGLDGIPIKELLDNTVGEATQEANRAKQEADRAKREADRAEAADPGSGGIESIVAGSGIVVDDSDPVNPIVSATGGGGVGVESIVAGDGISVDDSDPANPVISAVGGGPTSGGWDTLATPAINAGALTLDLTEPTLFAVGLNQNVTDLSFANLPSGKAPAFAVAFTQDATGGHTVAWPPSVIGTPPDIGSDPGAVTVVSLAYIGGGQYVISGAIYA